MNKEDLMQMAREAGFYAPMDDAYAAWAKCMTSMDNSILERAAVECDKKNKIYKQASEEEGGDSDFAAGAAAARRCSHSVRALKIND